MQTAETIKQTVREKYGEIAEKSASCCGPQSSCGCSDVAAGNYSNLAGYNPDADLHLGCGLPTEFAQIRKGDTVVDLGAGAGHDCFVARQLVGDDGLVIGIDMTEQMVEKARHNAAKLGFTNVKFDLGEIESLPLPDNEADVVVSNCVLNLVPDKSKAFAETFRIIKPGGHFSISDIVLDGELPEGIQQAAEMYAGCVSGALQKSEYLRIIAEAGFENIEIQKERAITLPDDLMLRFIDEQTLAEMKKTSVGIYSVTVYAEKPSGN